MLYAGQIISSAKGVLKDTLILNFTGVSFHFTSHQTNAVLIKRILANGEVKYENRQIPEDDEVVNYGQNESWVTSLLNFFDGKKNEASQLADNECRTSGGRPGNHIFIKNEIVVNDSQVTLSYDFQCAVECDRPNNYFGKMAPASK